jgi:hypothetical protein
MCVDIDILSNKKLKFFFINKINIKYSIIINNNITNLFIKIYNIFYIEFYMDENYDSTYYINIYIRCSP